MLIRGWRLFLLQWLFRDIIKQEPHHFSVTAELYELIRQEWNKTFFENNATMIDESTLVAFNRTLRTGEAKFRRF